MTNMFLKIEQPMPPLRGLESIGHAFLQRCHAYGVRAIAGATTAAIIKHVFDVVPAQEKTK